MINRMTSDQQSPKPKPEEKPPTGLSAFWAELKRRKVMRVAITYAVVSWLLIQISATVFPQFDMPMWTARLVTLLLAIGFPIALIIAWAFELSPDGIKTTKAARTENPDAESDFATAGSAELATAMPKVRIVEHASANPVLANFACHRCVIVFSSLWSIQRSADWPPPV